MVARSGQALVVVALHQIEGHVLDRSVGEHDDHRCRSFGEADQLDVADRHRFGAWADNDRCAVRQLCEQVRRLVKHLLQLPVRGGEELPDLTLGRTVEPAGRRQMIDEVAIALVGGDASGRRVRLDQEPLLLQHGEFAPDGSRRHLDRRHARNAPRSDGLCGRDVLLHDGSEDRCLAVVQHRVVSLPIRV